VQQQQDEKIKKNKNKKQKRVRFISSNFLLVDKRNSSKKKNIMSKHKGLASRH
jgi:hypothetical protein